MYRAHLVLLLEMIEGRALGCPRPEHGIGGADEVPVAAGDRPVQLHRAHAAGLQVLSAPLARVHTWHKLLPRQLHRAYQGVRAQGLGLETPEAPNVDCTARSCP